MQKKIRKYEYPYPECETCNTLDDCKHGEVAMDGMGSDMPPDNCPNPITIMENTLHLHKLRHSKS